MQIAPARTVPVVLLIAAACSSTPDEASTRTEIRGLSMVESAWIAPSPILEREIEEHAARLPYLQKIDDFRNEITWFVQVGEPAYPTLLDCVRNEDPKVAGAALAALAASGDARVISHLEEIPWPSDPDPKLRYERARCHVKLGDWGPMGILVGGLEDPDLWNRALCFKALKDETNHSFDYHPRLEGAEREASVAAWREWLAERDLDSMLER